MVKLNSKEWDKVEAGFQKGELDIIASGSNGRSMIKEQKNKEGFNEQTGKFKGQTNKGGQGQKDS